MGRYSLTPLLWHNFMEAIRTRWLITFSIVFFLLAIDVPTLISLIGGYLPASYLLLYLGYLVSLSFPYLPLLSLPVGAASVVQEKESRSIEYVLSTRLTRQGFLTAKLGGLLLATTGVIVIGYGLATLIIYRADLAEYVIMLKVIMSAIILNTIMLLFSLLISLVAKRRETAIGMAVFVWFVFSVISNLAQLSVILNVKNFTSGLVVLTLLDPVESCRILAVLSTNALQTIILNNPAQLGATGLTIVYLYGETAVVLLLGALMAWIVALLTITYLVFRKQDIV